MATFFRILVQLIFIIVCLAPQNGCKQGRSKRTENLRQAESMNAKADDEDRIVEVLREQFRIADEQRRLHENAPPNEFAYLVGKTTVAAHKELENSYDRFGFRRFSEIPRLGFIYYDLRDSDYNLLLITIDLADAQTVTESHIGVDFPESLIDLNSLPPRIPNRKVLR